MIFSLDVRRARKGDCMLLHFGSKQAPGLIVVDGGPKAVYGPHLKPRLTEIRKARKLDAQESLPIDLLMVSHVDDDHIQGILDLTKELIEAQDAHKPLPVRIMGLWHNSFDHIIRGRETHRLPGAVSGQFGAAAINGSLPKEATVDADDPDLNETDITANLKVLASIPQGFRLRDDAKKLGVELNPELAGELIVAAPGAASIEIADGALRLTIAGPLRPELDKLRQKHEAWLIELKKQGKTPADALAAYVDNSIPNLSSIVVLVEAAHKTLLLTGDARGDKILKGMETVGILPFGGKRHLDVLKAPHHGSSNNLDHDFFERLTADHYVFSGNGEHGNPERETLEMLLKARGEQDAYRIHLTYPIAEIDEARQADWNKERKKEIAKQQKDPNKPVRPIWSADSHSLRALFDAHPKFEAKVKIVDKAKSHLIDLGEPLGETWPDLDRH
jgi:hypothetical protein